MYASPPLLFHWYSDSVFYAFNRWPSVAGQNVAQIIPSFFSIINKSVSYLLFLSVKLGNTGKLVSTGPAEEADNLLIDRMESWYDLGIIA